MKTITNSIYVAFAVFASVCFCLSPAPSVFAVSPAPDGGYANGNTAEGTNALFHLTTGAKNTADGYLALFFNTSGRWNTAIGSQALYNNTTGSGNTALGLDALFYNTTGYWNTASGYLALFHNTAGAGNTADGYQALMSNTNGSGNTAIGVGTLFNHTAGSSNIALGPHAGSALDAGNYNIYIGSYGVPGTENNTIRIGFPGLESKTFIEGIYNVNEGGTILPVYVNSDGQLGTQPPPSSERFKKEIKPMDQASESILALQPVTFHYKSDKTNTPQFGLIAEEVAKVNPDLVMRDERGEIYTVRYDAVNALLLNEFLKEHRKVQEQESSISQLKSAAAKQAATLAQQQEQIEALTAGLQKVSAQVQMNGSAPQLAGND
jgi:uncharacterized coiled-coil protein SlyX